MDSLAFDEGMLAFHINKGRDSNPYQPGTDYYKEWNDGYDYAEAIESGGLF